MRQEAKQLKRLTCNESITWFTTGACLRSTYESNIDETPAGKLATSLFGAITSVEPLRPSQGHGLGWRRGLV